MKPRLLIAILLVFVASAGAGFGATAYRVFYPKQGDRVILDDLDLSCFESHRSGAQGQYPQTFACGNTASQAGPYVRITPTRITIAATSQRILYTVKRNR